MIEFTYYMITRPTRAGRRPASFTVHPTRAAAKAEWVGQWESSEAGEYYWRRALDQDGWRIDPVTIRLDDESDA